MLQIRETLFTHHYAAQIRTMYSMPFQRLYITKHHQWEKKCEEIEWSTIKPTYKDVSFYKKMFLTKWLNKTLPLNYRQHKKKIYPTPKCSCCDHLETDQYLLHCQHKSKKEHSSALKKIEKCKNIT